jgi:hypothetical protein
MATWSEVGTLVQKLRAERLNDTMWKVPIEGADGSYRQEVFVSYELMQPDFEFVKIQCLLGTVGTVGSMPRFFAVAGNRQVGTIGFTPMFDDNGEFLDGALDIGTTIPLDVIDLSNSSSANRFALYLHVLAGAANSIEHRLNAAVVD